MLLCKVSWWPQNDRETLIELFRSQIYVRFASHMFLLIEGLYKHESSAASAIFSQDLDSLNGVGVGTCGCPYEAGIRIELVSG